MGILDSFFQPPNTQNQVNAVSGILDTTANRITSLASDLDTAAQRLFNSGLPMGGVKTFSADFSGQQVRADQSDSDWRVRISSTNPVLYNNNDRNSILQPLYDTKGLVFPYTPSIIVTHVANYNIETPTHSNYAFNFYESSSLSEITVTGDFTAETPSEAAYVLAVLHFCRSATKMFYGQDANAGSPPPILHLDGYGTHMFPHVPVVMTNCQIIFEPDVDFIPVQSFTRRQATIVNANEFNIQRRITPGTANVQNIEQSATTMVPSKVTLAISLAPSYPKTRISTEFSLQKFASGQLLRSSGNKGGFI